MLNGLDLFTGIGGLTIALKEWVRPLAYCEIDPYCQTVLLNRQFEGLLPVAPIWDNIRTLRMPIEEDGIDIIYGGFPCQDISIAGTAKGLEGERSSLCYDIFRISDEIRPRFIFLENVPAITSRGGVEVVKKITKMGYDCRWLTLTASSVGAPHKRERWFLLAYAKSKRFNKERLPIREKETQSLSSDDIEYAVWNEWKESPSPFLGMDDDVPKRVDRTKALGNSVVPKQAKKAFEILMGLKQRPLSLNF